MTIPTNITNTLIQKLLPSFQPETSVCLEKFKIRNKSQFERGDAEYYLQLTADTKITPIQPVCMQQRLILDTKISQLVQSPKTYPIASLGVLVPSYKHEKDEFRLQIRDGPLPSDAATIRNSSDS